ncbi:2 TM domain-containing transmembrane protein Rft1 [Acrasis kona]|uniref:2 TM domain-containing transmembrane protein Rft1 n=1 Tax=Acrasis kona TaxID=1008807 RepID=A0AAW2ZFC2_9EUKA
MTKTRNLKFIALSCDRYFDDQDDSHWKLLLQKEQQTYDGMIHMGDQIYADSVVKAAIAANITDNETLREEFRKVYRRTWSHPTIRTILKHGPHWMFPDDHDILNNLDREFITGARAHAVKAGREVFLEYQYALHSDFDGHSVDHIYFNLKISPNVVFMFVDTRFERTFNFNEEHSLLGSSQFTSFQNNIIQFGSDPNIKNIVVFTSVPLGFFSESMSKLVYKIEQERYPSHPHIINDTLQVLNVMKPYHDKILVVSGDVHQFVETSICDDKGICIEQLISSGITNGSAVIHENKLFLFFTLGRYLTSHILGQENGEDNQWYVTHKKQHYATNYAVISVGAQGISYYGVVPDALSRSDLFKVFVFEYFLQIGGALLIVIVFAFISRFLFRK